MEGIPKRSPVRLTGNCLSAPTVRGSVNNATGSGVGVTSGSGSSLAVDGTIVAGGAGVLVGVEVLAGAGAIAPPPGSAPPLSGTVCCGESAGADPPFDVSSVFINRINSNTAITTTSAPPAD